MTKYLSGPEHRCKSESTSPQRVCPQTAAFRCLRLKSPWKVTFCEHLRKKKYLKKISMVSIQFYTSYETKSRGSGFDLHFGSCVVLGQDIFSRVLVALSGHDLEFKST